MINEYQIFRTILGQNINKKRTNKEGDLPIAFMSKENLKDFPSEYIIILIRGLLFHNYSYEHDSFTDFDFDNAPLNIKKEKIDLAVKASFAWLGKEECYEEIAKVYPFLFINGVGGYRAFLNDQQIEHCQAIQDYIKDDKYFYLPKYYKQKYVVDDYSVDTIYKESIAQGPLKNYEFVIRKDDLKRISFIEKDGNLSFSHVFKAIYIACYIKALQLLKTQGNNNSCVFIRAKTLKDLVYTKPLEAFDVCGSLSGECPVPLLKKAYNSSQEEHSKNIEKSGVYIINYDYLYEIIKVKEITDNGGNNPIFEDNDCSFILRDNGPMNYCEKSFDFGVTDRTILFKEMKTRINSLYKNKK